MSGDVDVPCGEGARPDDEQADADDNAGTRPTVSKASPSAISSP